VDIEILDLVRQRKFPESGRNASVQGLKKLPSKIVGDARAICYSSSP
jgi:hypothetical protein